MGNVPETTSMDPRRLWCPKSQAVMWVACQRQDLLGLAQGEGLPPGAGLLM